jgi:hypothetical protein
MSYTIDGFWKSRLGGIIRPQHPLAVLGWSIESGSDIGFVEATIRTRPGYEDLRSPLWFVAAPGAVGKSTLAKQISAQTGTVYLDLAKADTVAGNYLTGGLVKNGLLSAWQRSETTCLIDALDEARLRVTQSSYDDFLSDLVSLAQVRNLPTVLFGRVGIVDETWLLLKERGLHCPIFEIDFFDRVSAKKFVLAELDRLAKKASGESFFNRLTAHRSVYEQAADGFVARLERATASDGARFAGYAPVLQAVSTVLSGVTNPASLDHGVQESMQQEILQRLMELVLERESTKLREQLIVSMPAGFLKDLYTPDEQLARLVGRILGTKTPVPSYTLPQEHIATYESAVETLMAQHPFLDGTGQKPSGAVFGAAITAFGLFSPLPSVKAAAERYAGDSPHTPNPFLVDFYLHLAERQEGASPLVAPEHVVLLYESVRARAPVGAVVHLSVEGDEVNEEAELEIQISNNASETPDRTIPLRTFQAGTLWFRREVNSVTISAPQLDLVVGSGNSVEMIAPISLDVARLTFNCSELIVRRSDSSSDEDAAVAIEARQLLQSDISTVPSVRKGAELSVEWPGSASYPWTHFASSSRGGQGQEIDDALRALRRLVLAFRSHSKGRLARFEGKIEHARITKGLIGVAVRERLLSDDVLSLEGKMYFLDPNALGRIVGATYQDLKVKRFHDRVREYVLSIVAQANA